ncbi:LemA family protein [Candidatus Sumerlaeota bacterium]|nr:LemA family protein [Candidatus Sumerlaeota bacterium]
MGVILLILLGLIVVLVLMFVGLYNKLVHLRAQVKNAWSQIDVQLKRRYDLIPNLVETAKGYIKHERETLEAVVKARQMAIDTKGGAAEQAKAENTLTQTLRSLFAVVENYPDLKANQNMLALQEELTSTENKISFARQFYNDSAMRLNIAVQSVPTNIVANMFNFKQEEFFEIEAPEERKAPKVQF